MLQVGERFPVEKLPVQPEGPAVVYFYPEDLTPGCTLEAKAFNDRYGRFREAGYEVIGISLDSDERHDEFRRECGLDFPLVADSGGTLTTELGLLKDYGEYGMLPRRVTFLLDADGVVEQVWDVKDAAAHPEEVLAAVTE
ncbi:MAG TPA: peroxiredoxin [Gaiellaceae bacterium]|nr:peroxiredoxin [Gaiellaceae bacterium]